MNANPLSDCPLLLEAETVEKLEADELLLKLPNDAFLREENDNDDLFMALRFTPPPLADVEVEERDADDDNFVDPKCKKAEEDDNICFLV